MIPAACEVSSVCRPQIASDKMIMYSTRMTQPSKRMVSLTPRIAMATSRQITVATTQVSGLFEAWPGAIRLSTVEPEDSLLMTRNLSGVWCRQALLNGQNCSSERHAEPGGPRLGLNEAG